MSIGPVRAQTVTRARGDLGGSTKTIGKRLGVAGGTLAGPVNLMKVVGFQDEVMTEVTILGTIAEGGPVPTGSALEARSGEHPAFVD
jgi:hypothetical protein